jgi:hypothetical protein
MTRVRNWTAIVAIVAGLAGPASASASTEHNVDDDFAVHVRLVLDKVHIDASVIADAKAEVARIYHAAGITIVWNGAGEIDNEPPEQFLERSLIILIRGDDSAVRLSLHESSLGMALSTPNQRGRVAFIYWNRVQKVAIKYLNYRALVEKMLALAMAHEIGHLLLPPGHSNDGLMKSEWEVRDFVMASRGSLLLSATEGQLIRDRLASAATSAILTER